MLDNQQNRVRVVPANVSLYPQDWTIIRQVAQATGQRTISGGLRALIAEYLRLKGEEMFSDAQREQSCGAAVGDGGRPPVAGEV